MTAQHTPGPMASYTLGISADSGYESSTEGRCTADQYGIAIAALHGETPTSLDLIAAAPDLLDAAQHLLNCCDESDGAQYGTIGTNFIRVLFKDAIAKATGGSE